MDAGGQLEELLAEALERGATDLHIDPASTGYVVRRRVEHRLERVGEFVADDGDALVVAARTLVGLGPTASAVSERASKFVVVGDQRIDLHVSTYPSVFGEKASLQILQPNTSLHPLEKLLPAGFPDELRAAASARSHGIVLITGPTGSGKDTVRWALVADLQRPDQLVMTIEEGIYVHLDGVVQAKITPDFSMVDGIRAMEDNDADLGVVGSLETPEVAAAMFQCAQSGRRLLSSLHAPDAVGALHRLVHHLGVRPTAVVEQLLAIEAQRLVRRACRECSTFRLPTSAEADRLGLDEDDRSIEVADEGDTPCGHQIGRTVVVELLTMTPALAAALERGEDVAGLRRALGESFVPIEDRVRTLLLDQVIGIQSAFAAIPLRIESTPIREAAVESATHDAEARRMAVHEGTVTIMFTDIVGSTSMTAEAGDSGWMEIQRHHDDLLRKLVAEWGGREIKSVGDGLMVVFPSAAAAVRCGLAIQSAAGALLGPSGEAIQLRVGIHTGEPVRRGDDFFGLTVILASRINSAALPGEVLVSDLVQLLLVSSGGFDFGEPRSVELKGLEGSHLLYPVTSG